MHESMILSQISGGNVGSSVCFITVLSKPRSRQLTVTLGSGSCYGRDFADAIQRVASSKLGCLESTHKHGPGIDILIPTVIAETSFAGQCSQGPSHGARLYSFLSDCRTSLALNVAFPGPHLVIKRLIKTRGFGYLSDEIEVSASSLAVPIFILSVN